MTSAILILNACYSTLKFALYEPSDLAFLRRGTIGGIGGVSDLKVRGPKEAIIPTTATGSRNSRRGRKVASHGCD